MKIKYLITTVFLFITLFAFAQEFAFIGNNLHLMSEEEILTNKIQLTADIIMYDKDGNTIDQSQINDIMSSGNFIPVIFGDDKFKAKALVFRNATKEEKEQMRNAMSMNDPNASFVAGEKAKYFKATDINGEIIDLKNLRGKVVVLNFWFTDCQPCVAEMPELNKLVAKYNDVAFLAITFDSKGKLERFFKTHKFDYTIISNNNIINDYKVRGFPLNILIDQNGEIVFKKTGPFIKELDVKIGMLLQ